MLGDDRVVTGSVVFAGPLRTAGAVLRILVEEVTRADAVASVAARLDVPLASPAAGGATLPFTLPVHGVDARKRYAVRVHVDASGNGVIKAGDHISTESHPVLTQGYPSDVCVSVFPI